MLTAFPSRSITLLAQTRARETDESTEFWPLAKQDTKELTRVAMARPHLDQR